MTSVQAEFRYGGAIGERQASALSSIRQVYGIWGLGVDQKNRRIIIDYDASRLTLDNIGFLLRNARVRVESSAATAANPQLPLESRKAA